MLIEPGKADSEHLLSMKIHSAISTLAALVFLTSCGEKSPASEPHAEEIGYAEISEHSSWVEICAVLDEFLAEGIMKIQVNELYYEYHCAHCIGIGFQGEDPILIDPSNPGPFYEWCSRNKGKYPQLFFGDQVKYPQVEQIFRILNERGFIFYLYRSSGSHSEIRADLYDGRYKTEKTPEYPAVNEE